MSTVSEAVARAVDHDIFLQEALARDIVNYQALATWLIRNRGIDGSQDSVAKALRRCQTHSSHSQEDAARAALDGGTISVTGSMVAMTLRRSRAVHERLDGLLEAVSVAREDTLHLVTTKGLLAILVPADQEEKVLRVVGPENVDSITRGLVELALEPTRSEASGAAVLGIALAALTARGINVAFVLSGVTQQLIIVPEDQREAAFQVLLELTLSATA